ncbi:MAG: replicative DNA helicase [Spirulinaceae cyanobacterium]
MAKNSQIPADSLPPHNIEAEESILGGILLDPQAMGRVVDLLTIEAFYIKAHQYIYQAALSLHGQGKPVDLMTLTSWLEDHDFLEKVGGTGKLVQLLNRTISAINIDLYSNLVMDKYVRRQLITAGHEVVDLGYDTTLELDVTLDKAEQKIFGLSQKRPQQGLVPISATLVEAFNNIESLQQEGGLPGLDCDFYDLDAMTSGFQRSDLVILAGRPSMGKTALGLNIAANIAKKHRLPVAIFSLEMSKEQLSQRLLSSEAEVASNRLRSGKITQNEYEPISLAIASLSELPIFIDDTPNMTVMQMRSQSRRLQAEQGNKLGLVLLDYLQLMEGSGSDNRVQELSRITRALKTLAREVNAPVIALSQLSRGVESRNNKRPMMSDLRESGCLTGDTLIALADSPKSIPLQDLIGKAGFRVWALNPMTMKLEKAVVSHGFSTGIKTVFRLKTSLGRTIRATGNHKFLTTNGWQRLDKIQQGDKLALPFLIPDYSTTACQKGDQLTQEINNNFPAYSCLLPFASNLPQQSDVYWDEITTIKLDKKEEVFDLTVPQHHNFVANNIIVHNSIEQDADLVIMLYRDSYYNPDSPDRDLAEVIIAKHRNGPTGTVKLLFQPELTKFLNVANKPNSY